MTMKGSLPDASISTRLNEPAQACATACPVAMLPVKATMWVSGLLTSCCPTRPPPVTHWMTPAGRCAKASMNFSVVSEVISDGLMITVLPQAIAAAASQHNRQSG